MLNNIFSWCQWILSSDSLA